MATRRKKAAEARELAEITPSYAIKELKGCLYRTYNQKASARNYEDATEAISIYIRKQYPEVADEITTKRKAEAVRPSMPRRPKRRKKVDKTQNVGTAIKKEEDPSTVEMTEEEKQKALLMTTSSIRKQGRKPETTVIDSDSDGSSDEEYEDQQHEYEEAMDLYNYEKKRYVKKVESIEKGRMYARDVILAQCTREMREKLANKPGFEKAKEESNVIALLGFIRTCGLDFSDEGYLFQNMIHVLRDLLTYVQGREVSNLAFREGLDTRVQKFEQMGGNVSTLFKIKSEEYSSLTPEQIKERILAVIMIDQSCEDRFGDFKKSRNEDAHLGRTDFPATRTRAAIALDNHCNTTLKPKTNIGDATREDMTQASSFAQFPAKDGSECGKGLDGGI